MNNVENSIITPHSKELEYFLINSKISKNAIKKIMQANPKHVEDYRAGKEKLFGFFVGQVMKEMKGHGNPELVNELLKKLLQS